MTGNDYFKTRAYNQTLQSLKTPVEDIKRAITYTRNKGKTKQKFKKRERKGTKMS